MQIYLRLETVFQRQVDYTCSLFAFKMHKNNNKQQNLNIVDMNVGHFCAFNVRLSSNTYTELKRYALP